MNIFSSVKKEKIKTIQINMGNLCNQACFHCHINASPNGEKNVNLNVAQKIVAKIKELEVLDIEFTGGTPEMNPHFIYMLKELNEAGKNLVVRSSITILEDNNYKHFIDLYKNLEVKIIASLPTLYEETTNLQRGDGVFNATINALKNLNKAGYSTSNLKLDLVYNPTGAYLPKPQQQLENEYKKILKEKYAISFNKLISIVNMPIKRFKKNLDKSDQTNEYMKLLKKSFNPKTLNSLMCKNTLSIDYAGNMYDCDFNQALGLINYENKKFWEYDFSKELPNIIFQEHCFGCTAGGGSSCGGELVNGINIKESVKFYYGEELKTSKDLKTNACCTTESVPKHIKDILPYIADEVVAKYYGCGSVAPLALTDQRVLDLGCGSGRDVYILSKLVGENGFVNGIDMTKNQIDVAIKHKEFQKNRFGYKNSNVNFVHDEIENIDKHFKTNSLDIVVSNCVINLIEDKQDVLNKVYQILDQGGEFYFSDVYCDRRLSDDVRKDRVLYGECLGGALYINDFENMAKKAGFISPRIISSSEIEIKDERIKNLVKNAKFYSITYRLWKIDNLEDSSEDYGHIVIYKGGVKEQPHIFELDNEHFFEINRPVRVCGSTALMIQNSRFGKYFEVIGNFNEHFGLLEEKNISHKKYNQTKTNNSSCGC